MAEIKMIVGLGNPGDEYADTRHNCGFNVIDSLAQKLDIDVKKKKFGARFGEGEFANKKLILLKPQGFMNCSGQVAATAVGFYNLEVSDLIVIADELQIEPGRIRVSSKGSSGGHNGLSDVIEKLGTSEFCRLRIGIGQSNAADKIDYVLSKPAAEEQELLESSIEQAREAVLCWIEFGIDKAMNKFNENKKEDEPEPV